MQINGFNKVTLLDYPKHLAATIFLGGCNMRCPFCHNASLVTTPNTRENIQVDEILTYLKRRKGIIEGVCITGGEPTLYHELTDFIRSIKNLGILVKLDTNGSNPALLKSLAKENLIDYIAMDIKNSREKYESTIGIKGFPLEKIEESVAFLLSSFPDYEFRTTIVKEFHTEEDMLSIGHWIKGANAYYLQNYKDSGDILCPGLNSHTKETLSNFAALVSPFVKQVSLRGIE